MPLKILNRRAGTRDTCSLGCGKLWQMNCRHFLCSYIKIVVDCYKKMQKVSFLIIFFFYRMVRRNPGTSCELMTGKS